MTALYGRMQEQREQRNWAPQLGKPGADTRSGVRPLGFTDEAALHYRRALLGKRDGLSSMGSEWLSVAWNACVQTYNNL